MASENETIARRVREEIWNLKNFDLANRIVSAECAHHVHDPFTPDMGEGPSGLIRLAELYLSAFPDGQCTIEEVASSGDTGMVRWTGRGTHTGSLMGIPPTGKMVSVAGVDIYRIASRKIQETRVIWDTLGFLKQLGITQLAPTSA